TRLLSVHGRRSCPLRAPASLRTNPRRPIGAQKARRARRRVPFHIPRPARRGDALAQGQNPPALSRRALAHDTTASRASIRSSPQNCRKFSRRTHSMRVRAHLDPCTPPACAERSDPLALLRAILRKYLPPYRSHPACSAPAPAAFALRGVSV